MRALTVLPLLLLLLTSLAWAEEEMAEVPPPPPMPEEGAYSQVEEGLEPEVTIKKRGREVVEEYRINGQLYMIKITPSKGLPYYLVDSDHDGSLETRRNSLDNPEVVRWRIFTW